MHGSPGISRPNAKVMSKMPRRTGMTRIIRLTRKFIIRLTDLKPKIGSDGALPCAMPHRQHDQAGRRFLLGCIQLFGKEATEVFKDTRVAFMKRISCIPLHDKGSNNIICIHGSPIAELEVLF